MQLHIINGPNLNLLGRRQPEIYGSRTFEEFFEELEKKYPEDQLHYFQSNHEGALIDYLHKVGFTEAGIVFNGAAYTHYSYALADALACIEAPVVEVHISDIHNREDFRKISLTGKHCVSSVIGQGLDGYRIALDFLIAHEK